MAEDNEKGTDPKSVVTCCVCMDKFDSDNPTEIQKLGRACACGWIHCVSCLQHMFTTRIPRCCCGDLIYLHEINLPTEEQRQYQHRFREAATPGWKRLYCPVPTCSTFIPLNASSDDQLSCPRCETVVCRKCKQAAHSGSCPDDGTKKLNKLLERWGYKKCPGCGNGVRRMFGCSHMSCGYCEFHFCWGCLEPIDNCEGTDECVDGGEASDSEYSVSDVDEDERLELPEAPLTPSTPLSSAGGHFDTKGDLGAESGQEESAEQAVWSAELATRANQDVEVTVAPADNNQSPKRRRTRLKDLDLQDQRAGLCFGLEPDSNYHVDIAMCKHDTCMLMAPEDRSKYAGAAAKFKPPRNPMQCHACWRIVFPSTRQHTSRPDDALKCSDCSIMLCRPCMPHVPFSNLFRLS